MGLRIDLLVVRREWRNGKEHGSYTGCRALVYLGFWGIRERDGGRGKNMEATAGFRVEGC